VTADVAFERQGSGYVAKIQLRGDKEGERTLRDPAPSCTALAEAVAVTVALLLDAGDAPPRAPEPEVRKEKPRSAPVALSGWIAANAGAAFGIVGAPSLVAGPELGLELARHFSLRLGAEGVLPRSKDAGNGRVSVSLLAMHLAACASPSELDATFRPAVCVRGQAGVLRGEGAGYASANDARFAWFATGGSAEVGGRLSRFVWGVEAGLSIPIRRQSFSVEPSGIAYESSVIAAVLTGRVGYVLW
jgi:hypothetical protein